MENPDCSNQESNNFQPMEGNIELILRAHNVKKVVDYRLDNGKRFYKVKWESSWEDEDTLTNYQSLVNQFWSFIDRVKFEDHHPSRKKPRLGGEFEKENTTNFQFVDYPSDGNQRKSSSDEGPHCDSSKLTTLAEVTHNQRTALNSPLGQHITKDKDGNVVVHVQPGEIPKQFDVQHDEKSYQEEDVYENHKLPSMPSNNNNSPRLKTYKHYDQFRPSFVPSFVSSFNKPPAGESYKSDGEEYYNRGGERTFKKNDSPNRYENSSRIRCENNNNDYHMDERNYTSAQHIESPPNYRHVQKDSYYSTQPYKRDESTYENYNSNERHTTLSNVDTIDRSLKPFSCNVCGKRFQIKWSVTRHKREVHCDDSQTFTEFHQGSKVYPCQLCHKTYGYSFNLKRHMRQSHSTASKPIKSAQNTKAKQNSTLMSPKQKTNTPLLSSSSHTPLLSSSSDTNVEVTSKLMKAVNSIPLVKTVKQDDNDNLDENDVSIDGGNEKTDVYILCENDEA